MLVHLVMDHVHGQVVHLLLLLQIRICGMGHGNVPALRRPGWRIGRNHLLAVMGRRVRRGSMVVMFVVELMIHRTTDLLFVIHHDALIHFLWLHVVFHHLVHRLGFSARGLLLDLLLVLVAVPAVVVLYLVVVMGLEFLF